MKYPTLLGAILVFALLLTACGSGEGTSTTVIESPIATIEPTMEVTEAPTDAEATGSPAATDAATEAPATEPAGTAGVPVTGAVTVQVAEVGTFGEALVDGEGRSLYLFTNDTQNSGTSSCEGDCLVNWPPLLCGAAGTGVDNANANANGNTNTNGNDNTNTNANANDNANANGTTDMASDCSPEAMAGEGVDASLLGTITLDDGSTQVTYNGWPLYYYAEDTAAGDANGQGVGGVWFLVSPTGEMIEQ